MRQHPAGPIPGSLYMYDQLVARHTEAIEAFMTSTDDTNSKFWFREVEAAEMMLSYCPEHWAVVEVIRMVKNYG